MASRIIAAAAAAAICLAPDISEARSVCSQSMLKGQWNFQIAAFQQGGVAVGNCDLTLNRRGRVTRGGGCQMHGSGLRGGTEKFLIGGRLRFVRDSFGDRTCSLLGQINVRGQFRGQVDGRLFSFSPRYRQRNVLRFVIFTKPTARRQAFAVVTGLRAN